MRVLVAGGAGFIGSHLCEFLLERGHWVICLDNLYTGSKQNIMNLLDNPRFEFVRHDIRDPYNAEVDWIFNLACPASPVQYQKYPINTIETSVLGSLNLLRLARRIDARILLASTSEIYGDPLVHPQPEDYWGNVNPIGPRSCYDESKRVSESLYYSYYLQEKTDIRIVRIFNTYGPRMNEFDGRVVSNFFTQARRNEALTIYGDGKQTRSFCYVSDLVRGLYAMMASDEGFDRLGAINLGNPSEYSILEIAELVKEITGSRSELVYKPLPVDDPRRRKPDISKAQRLLGWQPEVPLREGLLEMFKHL